MRENRPYGSEGGEAKSLPYPYRSAFPLLRRLLRHGWRGAGDRRAAHVARLRLIVTPHPVHGLAVVPHHEIMQRPFVDVDEFALGGVLVEVAQQYPRLRH